MGTRGEILTDVVMPSDRNDISILPKQLLDGIWEALESGASVDGLTDRIVSVIPVIYGEIRRKKREKRRKA